MPNFAKWVCNRKSYVALETAISVICVFSPSSAIAQMESFTSSPLSYHPEIY